MEVIIDGIKYIPEPPKAEQSKPEFKVGDWVKAPDEKSGKIIALTDNGTWAVMELDDPNAGYKIDAYGTTHGYWLKVEKYEKIPFVEA